MIAVNTNQASAISKEELCSNVQDMCLHKLAPNIYAKLAALCEGFVNGRIDELLPELHREQSSFLSLMDEVCVVWRKHCTASTS